MATAPACRVCHEALGSPLYRSAQDISITSLCEIRPQRTEVSFCTACGHLQTEAIANLAAYYDQDYKILVDSEDEDQLYAVVEGRKIFRTDHQVATLLDKVPLPAGARVLDYGCAKSSTLRRLATLRPDLELNVFDVSEMYLPFWRQFIQPDHWAVYNPKPEWAGRFDVVTSFFALEHVADPESMIREVARLLKPGGCFYAIVPNVYTNTADFVVADHVHHFSEPSLRRVLESAGLAIDEIDGTAHRGAWVVTAHQPNAGNPPRPAAPVPGELNRQTRQMAEYWRDFAERVQAFERTHAGSGSTVIYGSGFYGTFIASCLKQFDRVRCFLDQNPHRQKQTLLGKAIVSPETLPAGPQVIYVGLNPSHARDSIQAIAPWRDRPHTYFFP